MYIQTCKPFPALGRAPFKEQAGTRSHRPGGVLWAAVQTSPCPVLPQGQLSLLHVYMSPPEPSLELLPALLHPLHLSPPHPPFLVYSCVPESFYHRLKSHLYLLPSPGLWQSILPTWLHVGCGTINTTYDFSK